MPNLQFSYYLGKGVYLYTNDKRLHQKIYTIASSKYCLAAGDIINNGNETEIQRRELCCLISFFLSFKSQIYFVLYLKMIF